MELFWKLFWNFVRGMFLEEFFGRIFLGEMFWEDFLGEFFWEEIFWEEFFVYIVKVI